MFTLANGAGILGGVLILSLTLSAQTFKTLRDFGSSRYGPSGPFSSLIVGPNGVLYGIAGGGRWGLGSVYELKPPASPGGVWTEAVLHSFSGEQVLPDGGLTMGPSGSLYGLAESATPWGEAFQLDPPSGGRTDWSYTVIYQFTEADGGPCGPLVLGSPLGYGQSLYGVSDAGGGDGNVYRLAPPPEAGGSWTHTTVYTFLGGANGSNPMGSLAAGIGGTLFGVTQNGGYVGGGCDGLEGCGTVFSLTPPATAGGPSTERVLHGFKPWMGDGSYPVAGLVVGSNVLYGTTTSGGEGNGGTVFSLTPPQAASTPMTETILYSFPVDSSAYKPLASLVLAANGVLYGTTYGGGTSGHGGTVFELLPPVSPNGNWTESILHSFSGFADGGDPVGLTLAPDGTLFGTTYHGGSHSQGTVFALRP